MRIYTKINSLFNSCSYRYKSVLIDPVDEWIGFYGVDIILLTHAHFDHIYGINKVLELNPSAIIYTNIEGLQLLQDDRKNLSKYYQRSVKLVNYENVKIINNEFGIQTKEDLIIKPYFTPGHHPSCISWVLEDAIFTGDSYIPSQKTVTNLPGGDKIASEKSIKLIKEIARHKKIYPGHKI